ncbi:unnamed protein product, partial [Cladocopium goreaui]
MLLGTLKKVLVAADWEWVPCQFASHEVLGDLQPKSETAAPAKAVMNAIRCFLFEISLAAIAKPSGTHVVLKYNGILFWGGLLEESLALHDLGAVVHTVLACIEACIEEKTPRWIKGARRIYLEGLDDVTTSWIRSIGTNKHFGILKQPGSEKRWNALTEAAKLHVIQIEPDEPVRLKAAQEIQNAIPKRAPLNPSATGYQLVPGFFIDEGKNVAKILGTVNLQSSGVCLVEWDIALPWLQKAERLVDSTLTEKGAFLLGQIASASAEKMKEAEMAATWSGDSLSYDDLVRFHIQSVEGDKSISFSSRYFGPKRNDIKHDPEKVSDLIKICKIRLLLRYVFARHLAEARPGDFAAYGLMDKEDIDAYKTLKPVNGAAVGVGHDDESLKSTFKDMEPLLETSPDGK